MIRLDEAMAWISDMLCYPTVEAALTCAVGLYSCSNKCQRFCVPCARPPVKNNTLVISDSTFYPHIPDRHDGDTVYYCLSVSKIFCNGCLRRGLTQGDEIWKYGRLAWVGSGSSPILVNFDPRVSPKAKMHWR